MSDQVTVSSIFEEEATEDKTVSAPQAVATGDCLVCGDKASGFHYGVFSCEGCKGFFRRSVSRGHVKACRWGNQCSMDLYTRRRCPECRLRSCKAAGMRPDCLLTQAQRRSKTLWRQRQAAKSTRPASASLSSTNQDIAQIPSPNKSRVSDKPLAAANTAGFLTSQLPDHKVPKTEETLQQQATAAECDSTLFLDEVVSMFIDVTQDNIQFTRSDSSGSEDMLSFLALLASDSKLLSESISLDGIPDVSAVPSGVTKNAAVIPEQDDRAEHAQTLLSLQTGINTSKASPPTNRLSALLKSTQPSANEMPDKSTRSSSANKNSDIRSANQMSNVSTNQNAPADEEQPIPGASTTAGSTMSKLFIRPHVVRQLSLDHQGIISNILAYLKEATVTGQRHTWNLFREALACKTLHEKRMLCVQSGTVTVQKYITFSKSLQGFNDLPLEDQVAVVKGSLFECFVMRVPVFLKECGLDIGVLERLVAPVHTQEFMATLKYWYEGMWKLNVDSITVHLLLCAVVLSPDRPNIKDRATLEKSQERYVECLHAYCKVAYPDQPMMFARLLSKLTEVRSVGQACEKSLLTECGPMVKQNPLCSEILHAD